MHICVEILEDANHARRLRAGPIGRHRHPVHCQRRVKITRQIGHHHESALENAH